MMVVTVAVVAVLVLIIVFMAVDSGSSSVTNVFWRRGGHHYPYGPGHSSRWGPYYQHGGRTPTNGLLY